MRFFRWATDRLGDRDGVICFVTNNSFADQIAFDGMRKHLLPEFTQVYHLDLHGNVRLLEKTQCFPLYTYALDGKMRRDNVTDWALGRFRDAYRPDVTKRDIFHYVYALLHHPTYRERYKENLKRALPRVPLVAPLPAR